VEGDVPEVVAVYDGLSFGANQSLEACCVGVGLLLIGVGCSLLMYSGRTLLSVRFGRLGLFLFESCIPPITRSILRCCDCRML
jgi:hypothetical protein